MMGASVSMRGVKRRFRLDGVPPVEVLKGVELDVAPRESVAIIGPSGSGKTTFLQILGAMDLPDEGRVAIDGQDLGGLDERGRNALRNRRIGFVFQFHHLLPQLTVLENVLVPAWAVRETAAREERALSLLERVGLKDRIRHRPGQLSGGERQRVALVRALILQPALVLADEPTGSLDHASAVSMADLLVGLNRDEGVTLIAVTHSTELAGRMSRRLVLRDGVLHPVGMP
jgi:lipoprotein-releasing system ATP-binding protein